MTVTPTILNEEDIRPLFNVYKGTIVRSRQAMTMVCIKVSGNGWNPAEREITDFLLSQVRQTDVLFGRHEPFMWGLLLLQSGANEAAALLRRLFAKIEESNMQVKRYGWMVASSIAEIRNADVSFDELLAESGEATAFVEERYGIYRVTSFEKQLVEQIKVSVIDENKLFRNALTTIIDTMDVTGMEFLLQSFEDGQLFLQSDWYRSAHTHIVIMNDILPRKTGLDILYTIRHMPNQQKFIVFMMTSRKSEEEMIIAYERGVDEFFVKPFNLRLFEARLKRTCQGLWR